MEGQVKNVKVSQGKQQGQGHYMTVAELTYKRYHNNLKFSES